MALNTAGHPNLELSNLFEPDTLAQAQFFDAAKRTHPAAPERRLMAAVLEDAVATLTTDQRRCSRRQRREFDETMRWVVDRSDKGWVFSFINVCDSLGLDPAFLRAGLLRKVRQLGDTPTVISRAKGRYLSPRRKVVRMRVG